jgi:putative transposase
MPTRGGNVMGSPRSVFPGKTYLLTRRTICRYFLLRPDDDMNELIEYSLAVAAGLHGMVVHAYCAMSTHIHVVLTDTKGRLPRFLAYFHRAVAIGTQRLRCWEGAVWDSQPASAVELLTQDAIIEKIAYVLANPVSAGAVLDPEEWPGAKTRVADMGQTVLQTRLPKVFYDPTKWAEFEELPIELPPMVSDADAETFRNEVAKALALEVDMARQTIGQRRFHRKLGRKRLSLLASAIQHSRLVEGIRISLLPRREL